MTERLRVIALTGGRSVPSGRFRVEQLVPALARAGVDVTVRPGRVSCYPPARRWLRPLWLPAAVLSRIPDVVATEGGQVTLLQREFISTLVTLEGLTRRPRVLDVDDAIWLIRGGGFAAKLAGSVDVTVAGNSYLAEWFGRYCARVEVLPTAVDTDRFLPAVDADGHDGVGPTIGWIGVAANYHYLGQWRDALQAIGRRHPGLRLRICADMPPPPGLLADGSWEWTPWSPAAEVPFLQSLDIGLMPLADTPWARGKCAFKMLQYMSCGVPAVVSPVGMNREVLDAGPGAVGAADAAAATAALEALLDDAPARRALGRQGRQLVLDRYSVTVVAPRLATILRRVGGLT